MTEEQDGPTCCDTCLGTGEVEITAPDTGSDMPPGVHTGTGEYMPCPDCQTGASREISTDYAHTIVEDLNKAIDNQNKMAGTRHTINRMLDVFQRAGIETIRVGSRIVNIQSN